MEDGKPSREECLRRLELDDSAQAPAIRRAYRRLALEHHPDRNGGSEESSRRFMRLAEAYRELMRQERERVKARNRPPTISPAETALAQGLRPVDSLRFSQNLRRRWRRSRRNHLMLTVISCLALAIGVNGAIRISNFAQDPYEREEDPPCCLWTCGLPLGLLLATILARRD